MCLRRLVVVIMMVVVVVGLDVVAKAEQVVRLAHQAALRWCAENWLVG
jgi:hypothetical protein